MSAQARGLTSADVVAAVSQTNALLPSGKFLTEGFDANVYTNAVAPQVRAIGEAVLAQRGGRPIRIKDVARIEDGGSPEMQTVQVDGQDAVYLNVLRTPGGNTLEIVDSIKSAIRDLRDLPPGIQVKAIFDQSTFVRNAYFGLRREIIQALGLIAIVILIFLQSVRGTLIVSVAIPLSFAITLLVLYATGQSLNTFTLGGLTLAMGRLIDNAVVVLESIHRHQRRGQRQAVGQGAHAHHAVNQLHLVDLDQAGRRAGGRHQPPALDRLQLHEEAGGLLCRAHRDAHPGVGGGGLGLDRGGQQDEGEAKGAAERFHLGIEDLWA